MFKFFLSKLLGLFLARNALLMTHFSSSTFQISFTFNGTREQGNVIVEYSVLDYVDHIPCEKKTSKGL